MDEALIFRSMGSEEETGVCDLVMRVFNEFIAPPYSREGVTEFLQYARPDALLYRSQKNHFVLLATAQNRIIGMIEIRDHYHVSMLFVDGSFQQRGVSRELLRRALEI
jgi:ribosomal protein S18 acetylase RimI-like enzyme